MNAVNATNTMRPLIFVTNDDGIASPGLHAAVRAVAALGDVLVVAPKNQRTASGRSLPPLKAWAFEPFDIPLDDGSTLTAYALDGSPAQTVRGGLLLLADRPPALSVSGINYGENVGVGVTISGTVGAAIEAAALGVPALAVSLEVDLNDHLSHSDAVDFSAAAHFVRRFAAMMLTMPLPPHTDLLKLDIPQGATASSQWRITRLSRENYFHSIVEGEMGMRRFAGYERRVNYDTLEADSDVHALHVDKVVAVTPMTVDLTAHADFALLDAEIRQTMVQ